MTPPHARPSRWWKSVAAGAVTIMTLVLVLRLIWGTIADRRLARELQLIRDDPRLQAPATQSSETSSVDDARNGAPLILAAIAAKDTVSYSPTESDKVFPAHPPFPPEWHAMTDAAVAANARTLALVRESRQRPEIVWSITDPRQAQHSGARGLSNFMGDAAMHAHVNGDDAEALERLRDMVHLSHAMARQHYLISHLVSRGIGAGTMLRMQTIAPGLRIPPGDDDNGDDADPLRRQVRAIIAELIDESAEHESFRRALVTERDATIQGMAKSPTRGLLKPMHDLDVTHLLGGYRALIAATTQPNWPAAEQALAPFDPAPLRLPGMATTRHPPRFTRAVSEETMTSLWRFIETDMRARNEHRFAAISLAAQLYRADHGGAWPASLEQLVPKYLPAVPIDALAPGNRPIGYVVLKGALPDGSDRPLLHSVGEDGENDFAANGGARLIPTFAEYGWSNRPDEFRDISRWSGAAATTTTTTTMKRVTTSIPTSRPATSAENAVAE